MHIHPGYKSCCQFLMGKVYPWLQTRIALPINHPRGCGLITLVLWEECSGRLDESCCCQYVIFCMWWHPMLSRGNRRLTGSQRTHALKSVLFARKQRIQKLISYCITLAFTTKARWPPHTARMRIEVLSYIRAAKSFITKWWLFGL